VGELALRPQWPGYLFAQDWRGWPERHVDGEPRLLKCAGEVVQIPNADVTSIMAGEFGGAFDPAAKVKQRRTDIAPGDTVAFDLVERQIQGVLAELSDDGRAVVRAMMLGRETMYRDVPADELLAISA
jgi:hypothetical protein